AARARRASRGEARVWRGSLPLTPHLSRTCRWDRTSSSLDNRNEVSLALRTTTAAIELGSHLDRKRHMVDIAFNLRRSLEGDSLPADHAGDRATHDDLSTGDHSRHLPLLTDDHLCRLHIAFNLAVDLQDAAADNLQPLADDLEVVTNYRFLTT